jgi:hypothetical protein
MVFEMGTLVWEMKRLVSKPENTVRVSKKTTSVAPTMAGEVIKPETGPVQLVGTFRMLAVSGSASVSPNAIYFLHLRPEGPIR